MKKFAILILMTLILVACNNNPVKQEIRKKEKLTVISLHKHSQFEMVLRKANEVMKENNSNLEIIYNTLSEDYYENEKKLKMKLMAGDSDFDIFMTSSFSYVDIAKNYAFEDLNKYSKIVENFNNVFDGIKQNCSFENKLFGVPNFYRVRLLHVNESLGKKLNVNIPEEGWSWERFYDLAVKSRQDINRDGTPDTYILATNKYNPEFMSHYLRQYTDFFKGKVFFDNKQLVDILKLWKKMWDEDLLKDIYKKKGGETLLNISGSSLFWGDDVLVTWPGFDNKKINYAYTDFLCINKNSKNKDLAAEFLSTYLSKEVQSINPLGGALYKDLSVYKESEKIYIKEKEDGVEMFEGEGPSNEKNVKQYEELMKNSKLMIISEELRNFITDEMTKFLNNETTAEKFAERLEQKVKMIVEE